MNESCHTYEWVTSHLAMGHVTHINKSCHTYQCTHINESCHTYEWADCVCPFVDLVQSPMLETTLLQKRHCLLHTYTPSYIHMKSHTYIQLCIYRSAYSRWITTILHREALSFTFNTHLYVCVYILSYIHIYIYAYIHMYVYRHMYVCAYICMFVCHIVCSGARVCTYARISVRVHAFVCVFFCVTRLLLQGW